MQTYVNFFNQSAKGVTGPFEVHGRSWEIFVRNLDVAVFPSWFVASNAGISWRNRRPSGSSDEFEAVPRCIIFEREVGNRYDDHPLYRHGVLFTFVGYRTNDEGGFECRWDERFPEG